MSLPVAVYSTPLDHVRAITSAWEALDTAIGEAWADYYKTLHPMTVIFPEMAGYREISTGVAATLGAVAMFGSLRPHPERKVTP